MASNKENINKKTSKSNSVDPFDIDVKEAINTALAEKYASAKKYIESSDYINQKKFKENLYHDVILAIEDYEKDCYTVSEWVRKTLLNLPINMGAATHIFNWLCILIEKKKASLLEQNADEKKIISIDHAINAFKTDAIAYCRQKICENVKEIEGDSVAALLIHVKELKRLIIEDRHRIDPSTGRIYQADEFVLHAASDLQTDIERGISRLKEKNNLEREIGIIDEAGKLETEIFKDLKNQEFTTTRQVLSLRYLLEFVKAEDKQKNARKKFIHFLTGKDKSTIGKKFDDEGLAYNKGGEDLSFVREQFVSLGLTEIVRMIDNDEL